MKSKSPELTATSSSGTESSPTRIASLLSHAGNQRVLVNWLQQQDQYQIISDDHVGLSDVNFDIGIFDEHSLSEYNTDIRTRKESADAFLPILLVSSDTSLDIFDAQDNSRAEPPLGRLVDEILTTPIEQAELKRRLDTLARTRAQSIALERKTDQLLLLNRITRHDIRNEMNVVIGWTEALEAHTDDAGEEIRQRVLDSSQHVVDLTKAVREFVETLQTADDPELQAINLEDVLTSELRKHRSDGADAEFIVGGEIPRVHVRANNLLTSVFRNVLNNAVGHNDAETPHVEISVIECEETVAVTIADNGPGIPSDQRDAVLGRTEQGLDHPAAGLGLYLVDTLINQYGGTVQISEADLGGTAIKIELPKESGSGVTRANDDT